MDEVGHAGKTESVWMASQPVRLFPRLQRNITGVHVCIVGAGITGLTTAYLLSKAGKSVVVIDDGPIAGGETERTTAHISNVLDDRYFYFESIHGSEKTKLVAQSLTTAVNKIESIVSELGIDCDFERLDGYLFQGENCPSNILQDELRIITELNLFDAELVDELPFGLKVQALKCSRQAQFHVLKYLNGLCGGIERFGGRIFSHEHVESITDGDTVCVATTNGKTISAQNLVIATNSPISDRVKIHTKQAPYRTYAVGALIAKGTIPTALYWDTEEPYHYVRLAPVSETLTMLIVGGEDHRTGEANDADERFKRLEEWIARRLSLNVHCDFRWSGQVYETIDGLGFIGRDPAHGENVYIATGDSGMGMTHGTISAMLLSDLICDIENPWQELYDPSRKPISAAIAYLEENVNSILQYGKKLMPSEVSSISEIPAGEGAIMRIGGQQTAIYKDQQGNVYKLSATCPHLGATVCWNKCEKSWDCPAHGSRFSATGQVVDGPANCNLEDVSEEPKRRSA